MIHNLEGKSKKELVEIVGIQIEEYQKLESSITELEDLMNNSETWMQDLVDIMLEGAKKPKGQD